MANGLKFLNGPQEGELISISVDKFIIGREPDCSLQLPRNLVSRHHCAIIADGYTIRLRDLGSKNGTYVNGFKIPREKQLSDGDIITVGGIALQYKVNAAPSKESLEDTTTMSLSNTSIDESESEITKLNTPVDIEPINPPHVNHESEMHDLYVSGDNDSSDFDVED